MQQCRFLQRGEGWASEEALPYKTEQTTQLMDGDGWGLQLHQAFIETQQPHLLFYMRTGANSRFVMGCACALEALPYLKWFWVVLLIII